MAKLKRLIPFNGAIIFTTVNTAKQADKTIVTGLKTNEKCYLMLYEGDWNETADADGAEHKGAMLEGSEAGTSPAINQAKYIPGTQRQARREGTNIFRGSFPRVEIFPPGLVELPKNNAGDVIVTHAISASGHTASLPTMSFKGVAGVFEE